MAWLSSVSWVSTDTPVLATVLNNIGNDLRTWGGQVNAGANSLVNLAYMRLNSAALPGSPSAGTVAYDSADSQLKFYNGSSWVAIGASTAYLGDPGGNGLVKRTALNTTTVATAADLPSHASRHQNGGADEIATSTAGANAIPKATSGGQLAAGWMPALTGDVTTSAGAVATTVAKIQGRSVYNGAPSDGQALVWSNANTRWEPGTVSGSQTPWTSNINAAGYTLTGLSAFTVSASSTGAIACTIENTSGSGGSASSVLYFKNDVDPYASIYRCNSSNSGYGGANSLNFLQIGNYPLVFVTNNSIRMTIKGSGVINMAGIPTSSAGLATGDLWCDTGAGNVIKKV